MRVSNKVLRVMQAEQISLEDMQYMVERAAITRLRGFNRRYFHWLFRTVGDSVEDMQHAQIVEIGKGDTRMLEDHDPCNGQGCRECRWVGQVGRWVADMSRLASSAPERGTGPAHIHRLAKAAWRKGNNDGN